MNLLSVVTTLVLSFGAIDAFAVMSTKADLSYVSPPASDAANQINEPVQFPRDLYPELEPL